MKISLAKTLASLEGNQKACVYTEPLWGLSINLCLPFASVFMLELGLHDSQIGLITTVFMLSQVFWAFFSGPITDKMGRRKTTAVFDFVSSCIPCIIWWQSQNFWFFFAAALFNGTIQVAINSWDCLLIEDAEKDQITGINSLILACGQLSILFAPIAVFLIGKLTLVPAVRILYINAFFVMFLKLTLLYIFSTETKMGKIRLEETKGKSIFSLAAEYKGVLKLILKSKGTIFALFISAIVGIAGMINLTFWPVIVSKKLLVPDRLLPLFPIFRSIVTIIFLFYAAPHFKVLSIKHPLLAGFFCYIAGQTLLILTPAVGIVKYVVLCVSLIFDSLGVACVFTLARSLVALHVNPEERARVQAILNMVIFALIAPFGWIGGILSDISRNLPFVLNLCFLVMGIFVTFIYYAKTAPRTKGEK